MTFRTICTVLAVTSLVVAIATACGPAPGWCPPPGTGYPVPAGISLPAPMQASQMSCTIPATPPLPPCAGWMLSAQGEKLQVQTNDGMLATCERLTIPVGGAEAVEVRVSARQVQVSCGKAGEGKDCLQGSATRVTRCGPDGAVLALEGNAKLCCVRKGKRAEVSAERIVIHLGTGHIESEMDWQQPPPPPVMPVTPPVSPVVPCSPLGPTTATPLTSLSPQQEGTPTPEIARPR